MADEEVKDSPIGKEVHRVKATEEQMATVARRHQKAIEIVAVIATVVSAVVAALSFFDLTGPLNPSDGRQTSALEARTRSLERRLELVDRRLTQLTATTRNPTQQGPVPDDQAKALDSRLKDLETALLDAPDKALSVVLLRRDVAELRSSLSATDVAVQRDVARVYDLTKLAVGSIFGMVLGVLSLVLTQVLPKRMATTQTPLK